MSRKNATPEPPLDPRACRDALALWLARGRAIVGRLADQTAELKRECSARGSALYGCVNLDRLEDLWNHLDMADAGFADVRPTAVEFDIPDPLAPLRKKRT